MWGEVDGELLKNLNKKKTLLFSFFYLRTLKIQYLVSIVNYIYMNFYKSLQRSNYTTNGPNWRARKARLGQLVPIKGTTTQIRPYHHSSHTWDVLHVHSGELFDPKKYIYQLRSCYSLWAMSFLKEEKKIHQQKISS